MSWGKGLCTLVDHSHKLVMMFDVMMMRTNHGVMQDIALRSPLRYIQGPCYNVHIIVTPSQSLDKALKACPVVSALQTQKISAQTFYSDCTQSHCNAEATVSAAGLTQPSNQEAWYQHCFVLCVLSMRCAWNIFCHGISQQQSVIDIAKMCMCVSCYTKQGFWYRFASTET